MDRPRPFPAASRPRRRPHRNRRKHPAGVRRTAPLTLSPVWTNQPRRVPFSPSDDATSGPRRARLPVELYHALYGPTAFDARQDELDDAEAEATGIEQIYAEARAAVLGRDEADRSAAAARRKTLAAGWRVTHEATPMKRSIGQPWVEHPQYATRVVLCPYGIVLVMVESDGARATLTMTHKGMLHTRTYRPGFARGRSVGLATRFAREVAGPKPKRKRPRP